MDQRRSTCGYIFSLFGGAVSWMSKRQSVVALSSKEAEYMAHSCKQGRSLVAEIMFKYGVGAEIYKDRLDSQSENFLAKNPAYHSKTKHIDVQYHFFTDMVEAKMVLLVKEKTLKNVANALMKSVST